MIYEFGPQAQRVYDALLEHIQTGETRVGHKLPSHRDLAVQFSVAPLTVRHVLSQLEDDGLVTRERGRGTFVRDHTPPGILVVDDELAMRALLRAHITHAGYRVVEATDAASALAVLSSDKNIALIFSDVRMPTRMDGVDFIRSAYERWPKIPLAAITGYPDDLADLHGTAECPILILPKPLWAHQVTEVLRMCLTNKKILTKVPKKYVASDTSVFPIGA